MTVLLLHSGLPVRLRDVDYLVVDEDMTEVLIRKPLLNSMESEFAKHLQKAGETNTWMRCQMRN